MADKLPVDRLLWATEHICAYGDTDIFPYPFELMFLKDCKDIISESLSAIDPAQYNALSAIESLVPKSRLGFRVAHQLYPIDLIIFSSLVFQSFESIEPLRDDVKIDVFFHTGLTRIVNTSCSARTRDTRIG